MKTRRFKHEYRKSSSNLHKTVGDILRNPSGIFAHNKIYQEYPVNKVNPLFFSGAHKFDWVILDLFLVIECHGQQHYSPVDFGGEGIDKAQQHFWDTHASDLCKRNAAIDAGFTYIIIPYYDIEKVTQDYIWDLYQKEFNGNRIDRQKEINVAYLKRQEARKEKARAIRRTNYQKQKECLKQIRLQRSIKNGS